MKMISVIVPLFRGKKYINRMVVLIEQCAQISKDMDIELIFINDDPSSILDENLVSEYIDIKMYNTKKNRGIHGARVRGLNYCKGDYVLFLDQDDYIKPSYFTEQIKLMGDNDAVVCNALQNGKPRYGKERSFNNVISKKHMITEGCMIVSPGQVLINRYAIPKIWEKNILKHNGADDWFLWISMIFNDKKIVLNNSILYEHKMHYENASLNTIKMSMSEQEFVQIIEDNEFLNEEELANLKELVDKLNIRRIRNLEKCRRILLVINDWMNLKKREISIANYLDNKAINNIAIYGMGTLGNYLINELKGSCINVKYVIDKNPEKIDPEYKAKTVDDRLDEVDAVLFTIFKDENYKLESRILNKINTKVLWLMDILASLY